MATNLLRTKFPISSCAFNADCSMVAVALENCTVEIWQRVNQRYEKLPGEMGTLKKHHARVTGIDWCPQTNDIVSVSTDRNAYVWKQMSDGSWNPMLVFLRIPRAAVCVKWSPFGTKFAVGSSARLAAVCYYEEEQKCYVSKLIKKPIRSTVTAVSWHPNNYWLATTSTDNTCRIFSAYIKQVEGTPKDESWGAVKRRVFGLLLCEFKLNSWGISCSFSPCGLMVAITSQDGAVSIGHNNETLIKRLGKNLPYTSCEWIADNKIVTAGHDQCISVFGYENGEIQFDGTCSGAPKLKSRNTAMAHFRGKEAMDDKKNIKTVHTAPVTQLRITDGEKGNVAAVATASGDGTLFRWNLKTITFDE